jgi:hypothetical protein
MTIRTLAIKNTNPANPTNHCAVSANSPLYDFIDKRSVVFLPRMGDGHLTALKNIEKTGL